MTAESSSVAYLITSLAMGGAQKVVLGLVEGGLHRSPPLVISLLDGDDLAAAFRTAGADLYALHLKRPWQAVGRLWQLRKLLIQRRVSVLYSVMPHANLLAWCLAVSLRPRPALLWSLHDTPYAGVYTRWSHRFLLWLSCRTAQLPDAVVFVSASSRRCYEAQGFHNPASTVIANGVRLHALDPVQLAQARRQLRTELGVSADTPLIGSLTRAVPVKDLPTLVQAFAQLVAVQPTVQLVLAGEGMDQSNAALLELLSQWRVTQHVHLLGVRHDAAQLIQGLDIATLCSISEAFPLFLAEAMALGVPCVATAVGDISHLFGGQGELVQVGDVPALMQAWQRVLQWSAPERAARIAAAWQRIQAQFSQEQMVAQHRQLFAAHTAQPVVLSSQA